MHLLTGDDVFFEVFFGWLIGTVLGLVVHEAGHAFAALATGMRVKKVVIGWGKSFFKRKCLGIRLDLKPNPSGGYTEIADGIHLRKAPYLFVLLAGSLCNVLLLCCAVAAWYYGTLPARADYIILGFVCAQIFQIAFALLPDAASVGDSGSSTDGTKIAYVLKQRSGSLTPVAECHLRSLEPYRGKDSTVTLSSASARLIEIHHELHHGHGEMPDEIIQAVLAELGKGEMSLEEELMVLDTLVSRAVVGGDVNLRDGMDEWSSRAMARGAHITTIKFSRAAVLIELGRFAEGKALIEGSAHTDSHPYDAVLNSIFLAKAEAGLGNRERAEELLAQANFRIKEEIAPKLQSEMQPLWQRTKEGLAAIVV